MRNLKSIAVALVALFAFTTNAQTKNINVTKSGIVWTGKKVTGSHTGTLNFQSGNLVFKKNLVKGGTFVVDMTTINTTDLKPGQGKENLDGHLKADDFFGVEKHKTATLVFTNISTKNKNNYTITADLTIKGITKPITFDLVVNGNTASTTLKVDRTKYDIKYGSGSFFSDLGDKTISDEFELKVNLAW